MKNQLEILGIESKKLSNGVRLSVEVRDYPELYFEIEGVNEIPFQGDLVVLTLLTEAMLLDKDLYVAKSVEVSAKLIENINKWQDIITKWYPSTKKIKILGGSINQPESSGNGVCCLFSGGADSLYSLYQNKDEITHLLFCNGMDIQLEETERFKDAKKMNQIVADSLEKDMVVITTNIRHVLKNYNAKINHMTIFAAQALAIGFSKLIVPASHNLLQLFPWGSHVLTDPLLSNGNTVVEHHGAVNRSEKIEYLVLRSSAIDFLRVCNSSDVVNCGTCEKCLRTMFALSALDVSTSCMPSIDEKWRDLKNVKIYTASELTFWQDNLALARKHNKAKLVKESLRICRRFEFKQWLKAGRSILNYFSR